MEQNYSHKYYQHTELNNEFYKMVSVNAYYRAEKRGFERGHELDDWYKAELEITNIYRYWFKY